MYIKDFKKASNKHVLVGWTREKPNKRYLPWYISNYIYTDDVKNNQHCYTIYTEWDKILSELCENGFLCNKYYNLTVPSIMMENEEESKQGIENCYLYIFMKQFKENIRKYKED